MNKGQGALTEYAVISVSTGLVLEQHRLLADDEGTCLSRQAENIIEKPDSLPFDQAAGISTVGLTAFDCLSVRPHQVQPGSSVFINGGSSSVGQMAVQIARNMGATDIAASCSKENHSLVRELGATDLYDYKASPLTEQLKSSRSGKPFDLIVDAVGSPELFTSSTSYLKPDGLFVTISADGSTAGPMGMAMFRPTFLGGTPRAFKLVVTDWNKGHYTDMLRWQAESETSEKRSHPFKT